MPQSDWGTMDPAVETGTQLATDLNAYRDARDSLNKGTAVPGYAVAGMMWLKDTADPIWEVFMNNGAAKDIKLFEIQKTLETNKSFVTAVHFEEGIAVPTQEWVIEVGTGKILNVKDVTDANKIPFKIEQGALTDSLVIGGGGAVGFGVIPPSANSQIFVEDNIALKELAADPASQDTGYGQLYVLTANSQLRYQDDGGTSGAVSLSNTQLAYTKAQFHSMTTLTDGATIAWDVAAVGPFAEVVLGGDRTMGNPSNLVEGMILTLHLTQDGTGTRLISVWSSTWDWGTDGVPTLTTAINKTDIITAVYRGTKLQAQVFGKGYAA